MFINVKFPKIYFMAFEKQFTCMYVGMYIFMYVCIYLVHVPPYAV